ncbi:MAG: hypothetical protein AB8B59_01295 [Maribacter sp.]
MRKSILVLSLVMLFSLSNSIAANPEVNKPKTSKAITGQIYNMLGENIIPNEIRGSKAEVRIAVDTGNYLRVLSVETENEAFENFIRTSIDFKKLTKGTYEQGVIYRIPLEVRK